MYPIDKPINLPLKDYLIRKTSVKTMINEHTVTDIINFQFKDARQALHYANEVELTGFGKFVFLHRKAEKEVERLNKMTGHLLEKERTADVEKKLVGIAEELVFLKFKLKSYEDFQANNRRLEKSSDTSQSDEGEDRDGISSQDGAMQLVSA